VSNPSPAPSLRGSARSGRPAVGTGHRPACSGAIAAAAQNSRARRHPDPGEGENGERKSQKPPPCSTSPRPPAQPFGPTGRTPVAVAPMTRCSLRARQPLETIPLTTSKGGRHQGCFVGSSKLPQRRHRARISTGCGGATSRAGRAGCGSLDRAAVARALLFAQNHSTRITTAGPRSAPAPKGDRGSPLPSLTVTLQSTTRCGGAGEEREAVVGRHRPAQRNQDTEKIGVGQGKAGPAARRRRRRPVRGSPSSGGCDRMESRLRAPGPQASRDGRRHSGHCWTGHSARHPAFIASSTSTRCQGSVVWPPDE